VLGPGPGPGPRLYRGEGMLGKSRGRLPWDCECVWPRVGDTRCTMGCSMPAMLSEKGITPARLAMSASPSCQCMASAARHGTCISSATFCHISGLNLPTTVRICASCCGIDTSGFTHLSYSRASLFLRSSSHSLRRSR